MPVWIQNDRFLAHVALCLSKTMDLERAKAQVGFVA